MREMSEQEIRTLTTIINNEPISLASLTRRVWGFGLAGHEKAHVLSELREAGMIKRFTPRFIPGKGGPRPTMYESTAGGRAYLEDYIEQQNSLGAA